MITFKNIKFNSIKKLLTLIVILMLFSCTKTSNKDERLYGLTIDDSWYETISLNEITLSLQNLKIKPTIRIVMSKEFNPKEYVQIFKELSKVAYIMAEPVDSYEMNLYKDVNSYRERFIEAYTYLKDYVNIWEIGNEVNGEEWINQSSELIIAKIMAAYEIVKEEKTALTFYYEKPSSNIDMFKWIKDYVPEDLKKNITYSFISYYEDENEGYQPEWQIVFDELKLLFPNSKIGFGECGSILEDVTQETKIKMFKKYYSMPKYNDNYIGGYFWWNYVEDCIPIKDNKIYQSTVLEYFK